MVTGRASEPDDQEIGLEPFCDKAGKLLYRLFL